MQGSRARRILVAGGAGFVGSHLCDRLIAAGHCVICLDNFYTGSPANIAHLEAETRFRFIRQDVIDAPKLDVDEIYNLACPASPVHYQFDPLQTVKTNVVGAMNLLELARRNHAKILQASTSEVYGDPLVHPQPENYWGNVNPIGPRACYDEGKRCAETLFFDYHRREALRIKVARIFNTYGPRMHHNDGRIVSNLIVQALRGDPLTIHGDGSQTRSFCYVSDLVTALIKLMQSADSIIGPINLGNPNEIEVLRLALLVRELTGSTSKIEFRPLPVDDPRRRKPDISLAESLLGWQPRVNLEQGIRRTAAYFRAWLRERAKPPAPTTAISVRVAPAHALPARPEIN